jgi:hypothetical protein
MTPYGLAMDIYISEKYAASIFRDDSEDYNLHFHHFETHKSYNNSIKLIRKE